MGACSTSTSCSPAVPFLTPSPARAQFHLGCVGLEHAPEGKWYCDDCVRDLGIDLATMRRK